MIVRMFPPYQSSFEMLGLMTSYHLGSQVETPVTTRVFIHVWWENAKVKVHVFKCRLFMYISSIHLHIPIPIPIPIPTHTGKTTKDSGTL